MLILFIIFISHIILDLSQLASAGSMLLLRISLACPVILFIPGRLILKILKWDKKLDSIEVIPLSFAVNAVPILVISIIAFTYHLNAAIACGVLYATTLLFFGLIAYLSRHPSHKEKVSAAKKSDHEIFMIAFIVILASVLFLALFNMGSPVLGSGIHKENAFHAITMKKIADSEALKLDGITYKKGLAQTYLIPQWHFMMALVAKASDVDMPVLYERIRGVLFLFMISLYYAFSKLFVNRRFAIFFVLCLLVMLIAGDYGDYYFSTFAPFAVFTHPGQIGAAICPMLLIISTMYALKNRKDKMFIILPVIAFSMLMLQARQGVQYIYHMGLLGVIYISFFVREKRKLPLIRIFKIGYCVLGTVLLGSIYKSIHSRFSPHIAEWQQLSHANTYVILLDRVRLNWKYAIDYFGMRNPFSGAGSNQLWIDFYTTIAFICLPLIIWFKRHVFALIAFSSLFFTMLIVKIPIMSLFITKITYSEFLQAPIRYIYWIAILLAILFFYIYIKAMDRLLSKYPGKKWLLFVGHAFFLYFVLFPASFVLPGIGQWNNMIFRILIPASFVSYIYALKYWKSFSPVASRVKQVITEPVKNKMCFNSLVLIALLIYVAQSQNFPFSTYHWNTRFSRSDSFRAEKLLEKRGIAEIKSVKAKSEIKKIMMKMKKPLWDVYSESYESRRVNAKTTRQLYGVAESELGGLPPYELIDFINRSYSNMVIAYPLEKWEAYQPIFLLPLFTDNFIYSSGKNFAGEIDFKASYESGVPLYPEDNSALADLSGIEKIILEEKIDLILVTPDHYDFYEKLVKDTVFRDIVLDVAWDKDLYMIVHTNRGKTNVIR